MQGICKIKSLFVPVDGLGNRKSVLRFNCGKAKNVPQTLDHNVPIEVVARGRGKNPYKFQENSFQDVAGIVPEEVSGGAGLDWVVFDCVPNQDIGVYADHL
jgi:hypothetical protein